MSDTPNLDEDRALFAQALRDIADKVEHGEGQERVGAVLCVSIQPGGGAVIAAMHPELSHEAVLAMAHASNLGVARLISASLGAEPAGPDQEELDAFNSLMGSFTSVKGGDA